MKVSTKGQYGLQAMLELAKATTDEPVMLSTIAEGQGISRKYLHALLTVLRSAGLVISTRGSRGGFSLARDSKNINLNQILEALEGSFAPGELMDQEECKNNSSKYTVERVYLGMARAIQGYLKQITLADLVDMQKELENQGLMYNI